jgi:hypothetical protein
MVDLHFWESAAWTINNNGNIQQAANDLAALAGGVLENGPYSELLIFRGLQNPHLIHTTPWVACVSVTLNPGFNRW